jgi:hypothetical protein
MSYKVCHYINLGIENQWIEKLRKIILGFFLRGILNMLLRDKNIYDWIEKLNHFVVFVFLLEKKVSLKNGCSETRTYAIYFLHTHVFLLYIHFTTKNKETIPYK